MQNLVLATPLACLLAALVAGFFGRAIGRANTHRVAIVGVAISFLLSAVIYIDVMGGSSYNGTVYTWATSGGFSFQIGFMIDQLSATMMAVVTFVSLMVHIYTIGYMAEDSGYQRFYSYISLFTFAMLMLVMSNNFVQLFFGWEAVGVISYLLIGFWYKRESAIFANLKAFLVNRVGDFGFLLGIAGVLYLFGTLDYSPVFASAPEKAGLLISGWYQWEWLTVICLLLFVGAMGKSAQVPLHVWLPDSMEGPTPISALIHAATMVTAGIFMVARMSPLFEFSETALTAVMVIGAITAFSMGLVGIVQNDIKRVVAYSTLSQLGYMTVALGVSAYASGIFHLGTHAFFKALLFLGAGSVIIAMHHEQDMRKMGGLRRYMPITYVTMVLGSLALAGIPPFAGFFSKDAIIAAVHHSTLAGSDFAYIAVSLAVFITAIYTFRLLFMTFHGETRMDDSVRSHLKESPWVVTLPLVILAVLSVISGALFMGPMLFGDYFGEAILVLPQHDVLSKLYQDLHHATGVSLRWDMFTHAIQTPTFWLALAGVVTAWYLYLHRPDLPGKIKSRFEWAYTILDNKYGFDQFNQQVFAGGARHFGNWLWRISDMRVIDGFVINGTARTIEWLSGVVRNIQSGFVYHYAFAMIIGLVVLMTLFIF